MTLFEILEANVIVASDASISMVAAWDGDDKVTYYQMWSATNLTEVDTYCDGEVIDVHDARELAELFFANVHREQKAA